MSSIQPGGGEMTPQMDQPLGRVDYMGEARTDHHLVRVWYEKIRLLADSADPTGSLPVESEIRIDPEAAIEEVANLKEVTADDSKPEPKPRNTAPSSRILDRYNEIVQKGSKEGLSLLLHDNKRDTIDFGEIKHAKATAKDGVFKAKQIDQLTDDEIVIIVNQAKEDFETRVTKTKKDDLVGQPSDDPDAKSAVEPVVSNSGAPPTGGEGVLEPVPAFDPTEPPAPATSTGEDDAAKVAREAAEKARQVSEAEKAATETERKRQEEEQKKLQDQRTQSQFQEAVDSMNRAKAAREAAENARQASEEEEKQLADEKAVADAAAKRPPSSPPPPPAPDQKDVDAAKAATVAATEATPPATVEPKRGFPFDRGTAKGTGANLPPVDKNLTLLKEGKGASNYELTPDVKKTPRERLRAAREKLYPTRTNPADYILQNSTPREGNSTRTNNETYKNPLTAKPDFLAPEQQFQKDARDYFQHRMDEWTTIELRQLGETELLNKGPLERDKFFKDNPNREIKYKKIHDHFRAEASKYASGKRFDRANPYPGMNAPENARQDWQIKRDEAVETPAAVDRPPDAVTDGATVQAGPVPAETNYGTTDINSLIAKSVPKKSDTGESVPTTPPEVSGEGEPVIAAAKATEATAEASTVPPPASEQVSAESPTRNMINKKMQKWEAENKEPNDKNDLEYKASLEEWKFNRAVELERVRSDIVLVAMMEAWDSNNKEPNENSEEHDMWELKRGGKYAEIKKSLDDKKELTKTKKELVSSNSETTLAQAVEALREPGVSEAVKKLAEAKTGDEKKAAEAELKRISPKAAQIAGLMALLLAMMGWTAAKQSAS